MMIGLRQLIVLIQPLAVLLLWCGRWAEASKPFVLRIRQLDGSIRRIGLENENDDRLTLKQVLQKADLSKDCSLQFGETCISLKDDEAEEQTLQALGIRHGSLLTLVSDKADKSKGLQQKKRSESDEKTPKLWNPFPELAKDYKSAKRQMQRKNGLSFGDLSNLHQALHAVEAQPTGPLKRLYLCQTAAERFAKASSTSSRVALLLGTVHRERTDPKRVRHKTSLSSTTEAEDYCHVAKVQAVWEPPQQPDDYYDATDLLQFAQNQKLLKVAKGLGLVPVGWMYSYPEQRHGSPKKKKADDNNDDDALPVFGTDVQIGAQLQIASMQHVLGREEGSRFVTVAMHAPTGATEVFQLSDVAVQMVAESVLVPQSTPQRFCTTKHAVLVDGQETTSLDSVLCLVNTALLPHKGQFSGTTSGVKKQNPYQLTKKTRKALAKVAATGTTEELLSALCNLNIMVALSEVLSPADAAAVVEAVRKYARGQKKGTTLDPALVQRLQQVLS